MTLIRITTNRYVCGIEVRDGRIVRAAPIVARFTGQPPEALRAHIGRHIESWEVIGMQVILNRRHYHHPTRNPSGPSLPEGALYVGRWNGKWDCEASPLGNPYTVKEHGVVAMDMYRRWLWSMIRARDPVVMFALQQIDPETPLVCWCVDQDGNGECHARIVAKAAEWVRGNV